MNSSNSIRSRLNELLHQLPYLPKAFELVWQAARKWTIAWVVLLLVQGLLPTATVLLTRTLVNRLVSALSHDATWELVKRALGPAVLMGVLLLLAEILRSVGTWVRTAQAELVKDHIHRLIHDQALQLDMAFYDRTEYYNQLHRARVDALSRPLALLENTGRLVQNSITLAALACVLIAYAWWLPLALLVGASPGFWVAGRHTLRYHRWRTHNTVNDRRTLYYDWMLTWHEAAAELRLFDLGRYFRNAFQTVRHKLRGERVDLATHQMWAEIGAAMIALGVVGTAMLWLLWQTFHGTATLGDLALFYQVFSQGLNVMRVLLGSTGEVYRNILFLENLFQFLALTPSVENPVRPVTMPKSLREGIRMEQLTFRYPGTVGAPALENFSLTLPAGKITAVVGENGAGKSTLIKLLCRFYDPESGRITLDGVDIKKISLFELRENITVLFQEPVHFHETAADNIFYGDLASCPGGDELAAAAKAAGAEGPINKLADGFDTVLGKWFGGAELSVGGWQRVALARAYLRKAPLIILDEPTSAMDSWAEADWMARFRELARGRTVIMITHRFTTALQADIIHVMMGGRIIESGSHSELVSLNGCYAGSWLRQTREAGVLNQA